MSNQIRRILVTAKNLRKKSKLFFFNFFLYAFVSSLLNSWIARDVIALIVKPLDVKIADQRYVNACKNTDSKDYRAYVQALNELILCRIKIKC